MRERDFRKTGKEKETGKEILEGNLYRERDNLEQGEREKGGEKDILERPGKEIQVKRV